MRIAVLWTELSGYLNACLRELASRPGVELFVSRQAPSAEAPFDETMFDWFPEKFVWKTDEDLDLLKPKLEAFQPEVVVVAGWHVPGYRRIMKPLKGKALRIMTMDNCWRGTLRQRGGVLISRWHVHPIADAAWVPGNRQATFARKLQFDPQKIIGGIYACDHPAFASVHEARLREHRPLPRAFIFVGRLVEVKNVPMLADAYALYRSQTTDPWPLLVCGKGPLRSRLENIPGIQLEGFVQPGDLPEKLSQAGCLILPSSFEPWALVLHEAASAGLLLLSSERAGAVPHLIRDDYNGYVFDPKDVSILASLMAKISCMSDDRLDQMSRASFELSKQFTPRRWADSLLEFAAQRKVGQG